MKQTLNLDPAIIRQLQAKAVLRGLTIEALILSLMNCDDLHASESKEFDETGYLFSTSANAAQLEKGLHGKPENRLKFESIEDVKLALGI